MAGDNGTTSKRQQLYDILKSGGQIKTMDYNTFESVLDNPEKNKKLYDILKSGGQIKTMGYDTFKSTFANTTPANTEVHNGYTTQSVKPTQPQWDIQQPMWGVEKEEKENREDAFGAHDLLKQPEPKPVETQQDVYDNYMAKFDASKEGYNMRQDMQRDMSDYSQQTFDAWREGDVYKELTKRQPRNQQELDELNKKITEAFYADEDVKSLLEQRNNEWGERYSKALTDKYGESIQGELGKAAKKEMREVLPEQVKTEQSTIDSIRETLPKGTQNSGASQHEHTQLDVAERALEKANEVLNATGKDGGVWGDFWQGFGDNFDGGNFFFGMSDMISEGALNYTLNKYERGEQLSAAEEEALRATAINMIVTTYFGSDLSRAYKAGQTSMESLPFMLEFVANPIAKSGNAIAKGLLKFATNKIGRIGASTSVKRGLARMGSRLVGDAAAAAGMTGTTSVPRVIGGAYDNQNANFKVTMDDGNLNVERVGNESFAKSLGRSAASNYLENQSEMVFNSLKGATKVLGRAASSVTAPKYVSNAINYITNSNAGKMVSNAINTVTHTKTAKALSEIAHNKEMREWMRRTQFQGLPEEYLEEVYNNFANVAMGEMSYEDAVNLDNNIDTFVGLAPTSMVFGVIGVGSYGAHRYRVHKGLSKLSIDDPTTKEIYNQILKSVNDKDYTKVKNQLEYGVILNSKLTPQQRKELIAATYLSLQDKAIQEIDATRTPEQQAADNEAERQAAEAEVMVTDPDARRKAYRTLLRAQSHGTTQDLVNAKRAWQPFNDEISARHDEYVQAKREQAEQDVKTLGNQDTGRVTRAVMTGAGEVQIVGGTLVADANGGIDVNQSSETIFYIDADGNRKMASPDKFASIKTDMTADEFVKNAESSASNEFYAQEDAELGTPDIPTPAQLQARRQQGDPKAAFTSGGKTYVISEITNKGISLLPLNAQGQPDTKAKPITMTIDEYYKIMERVYWGAEAPAPQAQTTAPTEAQTPTEAKPQDWMVNDSVEATDDNGNVVSGTLVQMSDDDVVIQADGKLTSISREQFDKTAHRPAETSAETDDKGNTETTAKTETKTETKTAEKPKTALAQIPTEEVIEGKETKKVHKWTEASPDLTYDAISEIYHGDAERVANGVKTRLANIAKEIKAVQKKINAIDNSDDFDAVAAQQDEYNALQEQLRQLDAQRAYWQSVLGVPAEREKEAKKKAEQEAQSVIDGATLNGVPDIVDDKPQDARSRGFRRVNGHKVDRQQPIQSVQGKEVEVKFADGVMPKGRVTVINASQLQPSHTNGQRNALHFLDEAQPKERKDAASAQAAERMAKSIRPEEITSSVTAFTGAPTVNSRGEVIQGNNRSVALKLMYSSYPESAEKYKQYLKAHAAEFGLTAEDIDKMQNPVMVNMLDVTDEDAIKLGQYVAQDTESGGTERIKPRNLAQKMGGDIKTFASLLLNSADSEASFSSLIDANGVDVLKWLSRKGYITETQYSSAFDSKGNLKAEAKNDLQEVLFQSIFHGGSTQLREMFEAMPAKAQRAILATAYRDNDSPSEEHMLEEIQSSIRAYYALSLDADFAKAGNYADARRAAELWKRQYQFDDATGGSYLPSDKFSNFALELAVLYKGETQKNIQARFNKMYDLIQGAQSNDLFGEADNTKRTLAQAIKDVLNIDYNGKNGSSVLDNGTTRREEGRQGSDETAAAGERSEEKSESADSGRGTEGVPEQAVEPKPAKEGTKKSDKSNKAKQEEAKKEMSLPTHKDWTTYKRKDGTWVNVVGNPKDGYIVRYYGNDETAAKNKEQWSIGEAPMTAEDLAMRMGDWTLDEPRLQRTEGGQKVTSEQAKAVTERLKALMPDTKVTTFKTQKEAEEYIAKQSGKADFFGGEEGTFAGATLPNGEVVLVEENMETDTSFHEFAHKLYNYAKTHPEAEALLKAIEKYIAEAPESIKSFVKERYGNLSEEAFMDEVFAWALSTQSKGKLSDFMRTRGIEGVLDVAEAQSWYAKIWNTIKEIWNTIKGKFDGGKYADLSVFDAYNEMSAQEIGERLYDAMMGGKQLREAEKIVSEATAKNSKAYKNEDTTEDILFQITKRNGEQIDKLLSKNSAFNDKAKEAFKTMVQDLPPMSQLAMAKWAGNESIRLPEDQPTVDEALKICRRDKIDPMRYEAPGEIIKEWRDKNGMDEERTKPLLSPDAYPNELTNKVDYGNGIVVYDVADTREGQQAVRDLMNDHLTVDGHHYNCWCLLYASESTGELSSQAWNYWNHYTGTQKKAAFYNGKIVSFCASNGRQSEWWDLSDQSHGTSIPVEMKIDGDKYDRSAMCEFDPETKEQKAIGNLFSGNKKNGLYREWYKDGKTLKLSEHYKGGKLNGLREEWYANGRQEEKTNWKNNKLDGPCERWYENGQQLEKTNWENGERHGLYEEWYDNGHLAERATFWENMEDGPHERWYPGGKLWIRIETTLGKVDGLYEFWYENGQQRERTNYKGGKRDGLSEEWHLNGQQKMKSNWKNDHLNGLYETWNENGQLISRKYFRNGEEVEMPAELRENGTKYSTRGAESTERQPLSEKTRKACESVAESLGLDIEWVDSMDANGEFVTVDEDGNKLKRPKIRIAMDAENPLSTVFGHEGTHAVRNLSEEAYSNLLTAAKEVVGETEWKKRFDATKKRYEAKGISLTDEEVDEEVVADVVGEMMTDKNIAEDLAYRLDHPTLAALRDVARRIWDAIKQFISGGKLTTEEQSVRDFVNTIERAFTIASGVSSETDAANADAVGGRVFNLRTEEDVVGSLRKYLEAERDKKDSSVKWTDKQIDDIIKDTEELIGFIHDALSGNALYDEWAKKDPTIRIDWRDGEEKPTVTWARNNIEYKYDVSADLLCVNNEGIESVLSSPDMVDLMIEINKSHKDGFTSADYMRLYETMRDLGLNVPCKGCFDAAMRFKMLPSVARNFVDEVNATIDKRNKNPKEFDEALRKKAGDKADKNGLPTAAKTKTDAIAVAVAGDNLTEHITWTQLMSAQGQTQALSDWGGIFRAWQKTGAGRPKDKLMPEPYAGILTHEETTIIAPYGEKTPSFRDVEVNQGTGLRRNSHSEFRPLLAIDEIQFMRDAFFKNLYVFKYMKELDDVRLFGKLGVKFNMSFFPAFDKSSPVAGLDKDGNYIASEESVGSREFAYTDAEGKQHFDGMRGLQEAEKHVNENVSLSSVVFSVPHLLKAFTDVPTTEDKSGRWGSLIPFHASGADKTQLFKQGLGLARGLASGSFMSEAFSDYGKGVTNFEDVQNDRFGAGWRIVTGKKKGTAVKEGHKIEFANGNHYYNEGLGLHLFTSFYVYDKDISAETRERLLDPSLDAEEKKKLKSEVRKAAGHDFVIDYNDKVRELGGDYAYKDAADFYLDMLPKIGLIPRFDFQVPEAAFLQMCEDAKVDPKHPKLGWKGEGHGWSPIDSPAYYSLFCDYGMTDPATGKWSPHRPVGYINESGEREFKLPDNTVDIVREGVARYTEQRDKETSMHDEVMSEYVKRTVEDGKLTQEQADAFMEKHGGKKYSLREHKAKATATSESAVSERERTLRDVVIAWLRKIGIPVIADESVQAVLDEVNAEARLQAKRISGRKQWINAYVTAMGALTTKDKKEIRAEIEKKLADAKREAKELYAKILSGNFDAATLQQINDYIDKATNENRYYRPLSQRLRKRALLPLQRGGRTGEVDALFSRVCESTVPKVGRVSAEGRRRIEAKKEELLEKWAKATNNWHESVADFTTNTTPIKSGTDSDVYLSNDGKTVIKASKGKFDSKKYPSDIDQVALFNSVFPHSAYRILGYGRLNGKFVKFLEQDLVDFSTATPLTEEERVEYMRKLGFEPRNEENTVFSNGDLIVSDLQKSNIVRDANGNVRVIDADVKLHTRDIGGKYEYPPVEEDTEVPDIIANPDDDLFRTVFGGNKGYVGYSKSKRAVEAEEGGKRSVSNFDADFVESVNEILREAGADEITLAEAKRIAKETKADEWHHTSMYGNKTNYYSPETIAYAVMGSSEDAVREKAEKKAREKEQERKRIERRDMIAKRMANDRSVDTGMMFSDGTPAGAFRTNGYAMEVQAEPFKSKWDIRIYNEGQEPESRKFLGDHLYEVDPDGVMRQQMMEEYNARLAEVTEEVDRELEENDIFRTSDEIDAEYPNWLEGTTNDNGKHTTQVAGTVGTYRKVGAWIESNLGKDAKVLDASSGMGLGTNELREQGLNVEDVEPYQSEERKANNPATYSSYGDIQGRYDYIISNAVLNVIPDNWRRDVLHDMAARLKDGGKLFINTRKAGEEKAIKDKIELDTPQEVLVKRNGKIASYQRFFTPQELKQWVEEELGEGYTVEIANEQNSGTKGLAAVVVTKAKGKNEQTQGNRMESTVQDMAEKLHLDNVEIVTDVSTLDEKHKNAKGWYNRRTGKIVIVLPNNESVSDAMQTLLHEAVAHYGLRKLFGAEFDTFLDSVYKNASKEVREAIDELAKRYNGNLHTATEEYLASLAENTNFDQATKTSWWQQIKDAFFNLLRSVGIKALDSTELTDNELRYILWASYKNLENQESSILAEAEDIAKQKELGVGKFAENEEDLFRSGSAQNTYNEWVKSAKAHLREAWQDAMVSVREFQKAVLADRGETMRDSENVYEAENRSHGIITNESEFFDRNFYKPLLEEFNAVAKRAGVKSKDLIYYMIAKHGLERNRIFAKRDGKQQGEKDYSGLTSLTGEANVLDAEAAAQRVVDEMERRVDTTELWNKVNAATKWTLKKAHDCGTISRDNYNQIRDMFKYYIPLRGWEEDTAGDIFDYVAGSNNNVFSPTVKKAKGRGSVAENPLAYIAQMAVSAIVQGNKNKVKQTFLNFVQNHPTNLVTVSEMWYRNYGTDASPDWREDVPYIPEDATADEIADIIKDHEDDMTLLEASGKAKRERGKLQLNVPIKKGQALEHHVEVLVNGKKYVLYVNGDPRLAQAINGTRARKANSESVESSKIAEISRWLARAYTSLSPAFTVSNLLRDWTMATALTAIKEDGKYAAKFQGKMLKLGGLIRMFSLMRKYKGNNLNMNNEVEKYFQEFMTNGAETGFTSLKDIERYKAEMEKEFGRMNQKEHDPRRALRTFTIGLENINRCIEDTVRFATYMTSREMGRSVAQSVADAKNITLNFNRKGSGEMGASTFRHLYIFVNPAIQALQTVASAIKHHPVRFSLMAGFIGGMGMVQPLLVELFAAAFGGGDDDWNPVEEYWNLPTWQRRNNYVIWIPFTHKFLMIPLGQEFRMIHGFGENLMSVFRGHGDENPALELAEQMTNLLPLDFTGNGGNPFISLAPTVLQTPLQIAFNTRFTGVPLFKDSEWNKYEPSFQKAYAGTPSELVSLSETLNSWTGGNEHKRGWIESNKFGQYANNPAVLNHLLQGYLGGAYTFVSGLMGVVWNAMHLEGTDVREIPIVSRVVTEPLETSKDGGSALPEWYYDEVVPGYDEYMNEFNQFMKEAKGGDAAALEHVKEMAGSPEFVKWKKIGKLKNAVSTLRSAQKTMQDEQKREQLSAGIDTIMVAIQKVMQEEEQ